MEFYSTNSHDLRVDLKEAVIRSLPADNGLYMPETITPLPATFWENWRDLSLAELGFEVANHLFKGSIPEADMREIVADAINFDAPVETIAEQDHVLELFHGPTLAFKDFGARFMARLMGYLTKDQDGLLNVLVATSGDTGGAVASAFHKVPGTRVTILYPKGKVSFLQEKQLTTLGENIHALEIHGTFYDCQKMVKTAFLDRELSEKLNLTSANSINISRLVPQSFYYFHAARQLPEGVKSTFVIPSGNFGNLTAGLLAQRLGLEVERFVAATNINKVVPEYLESGDYAPRPSEPTISNAMDVGAPSNFARMLDLFGSEWSEMKEQIQGFWYDDATTREAVKAVKEQTNYTIDPHGAVGWLAANAYKEQNPEAHTVVLETAHPSKFIDVMEEELGEGSVHIPERLACLAEAEKVATSMAPDADQLIEWLKAL